MKIDVHQHFWHYSVEEYGWIDDEMAVIRRDFLPKDLQEVLRQAGVDAAVSVQARQIVAETDSLLEMAGTSPFILGVVGWLPIASAEFPELLERYAAHEKLRGLRHVVQCEPDGFLLGKDFNEGVSRLKYANLAYDILVFERQIPESISFVDRHPEQIFVLDHIAKPRIKAGELEPWRRNMLELAKRQNVWCKLSGLVTEADYRAWTEESLQPYIEGTFEAFGAKRVLFGSDWPVCQVACDYKRWHDIVARFVSRFSAAEQAAFWAGNAQTAYNLKQP